MANIKNNKKLSWWTKCLLGLVSVFTIAVISVFIIINLNFTKQFAANKILDFVNTEFGTEIYTKKIEINYFGDVIISGLKIKDHKGYEFFHAERLRADSDWFSIISNPTDLKFSTITLTKANLQVITYKNEKKDNLSLYIDKFNKRNPYDTIKSPFKFASRILLQKSKVSIINQNKNGKERQWLKAENINAVIPKLKITTPRTIAQIQKLSFFCERFGKKYSLQTFSGTIDVNKKTFSVENLFLNTSNSFLSGNLTFQLPKNQWDNFSDKVIWDLNLKKGSYISGYDINYFVNQWDNYDFYNLYGRMNGVLNDFSLKDFLLKTKENILYSPEIKLKNIISKKIEIKSNNITTDFSYKELRESLPVFISKKMGNFVDKFKRIQYNGLIHITPETIITKGNLITKIGQVKINSLTLKNYNTNLPEYSASINTQDFNVTALTKNNQIKTLLSGSIEIKGQGFDSNTLSLQANSSIQNLQISNKNLRNIKISGNLINTIFNTTIDINEPNAKANLKGIIDFSKTKILIEAAGNISYISLPSFGIKNNTAKSIRGCFNTKASFSDINNLNLYVEAKELTLYGKKNINIPNGILQTSLENGQRMINIDIPQTIQGKIFGKFNLGDLGNSISSSLNNVLVGNSVKQKYRGQKFYLNANLYQKSIDFFTSDLHISENISVKGSFNGDTQHLTFKAKSSSLKYIMTKKEDISKTEELLSKISSENKIQNTQTLQNNIAAKDIIIEIDTSNPEKYIIANIAKAQYGENILKDFSLNGKNTENKKLDILANFKLGTFEHNKNNTLKDYFFSIQQSRNKEDIVLNFKPSKLFIQNFAWNIDASSKLNHSITYHPKTGEFTVQNLDFFSQKSRISINGHFKSFNDFNLVAHVKNIDIHKLLVLIPGQEHSNIRGQANGKINIIMKKKNFEPIINLIISDITISNHKIGNLIITTNHTTKKNIFDIKAFIINETKNISQSNLAIKGIIDNNHDSPKIDIEADFKNFNLAFIQNFVKNIFDNFRGYATGKVNFTGNLDNVSYNGDIALNKFGLKIIFSGVDYSFDDTIVNITDGNLLFSVVGIKDNRNNSKGTISLGQVNLGNFSKIGANLLLRADNLTALDTTQKDFDTFWGKVYAQGDLFVEFNTRRGLTIDAKDTKILENSIITFNSNTIASFDEFKMLRFLKEDEKGNISITETKNNDLKLNINLDLNIDKKSTVNVLVGDHIGNISMKGVSDDMLFTMNQGKIELNGTYRVNHGSYISKAILEKRFDIHSGSTLHWNGDALNPEMNITAYYTRMVSNVGEYLGIAELPPVNTRLETKITERLKNPNVSFDIFMPNVSSNVKEQLAMKLTKEEKIVQFGSILLLNNFNIANTTIPVNVENQGVNILFRKLSSVISSISNDFQLDFDYISNDKINNRGDRLNSRANVVLSPRIKLTGSLGLPISKSEDINNQMNFLTGEGSLEFDWSGNIDGSKVLRFYSKPSNIGMVTGIDTSANQSYGTGIMGKWNFNKLNFRKTKQTTNKTQKYSIKN